MVCHTLSPDGPSRRHGGFRLGPGSEECHDSGSAGPAASRGAGGGAPRDVAVPAAARRLPRPGAVGRPAASTAGDALTKCDKRDPVAFLQIY